MKYSIRFCVLIFAFALFLSFPGLSHANDDALPVEGIVYESKDPSQSFAVIKSNIYKKGDRYQTYEITEIRPDRVVVKNTAGQLSEHRIKGGNHLPAPPSAATNPPLSSNPPISSEPQKNLDPPASPGSISDLLEQVRKIFSNFDLAAIMNYAAEISIMADIRNLYTSANVAAMEEGDGRSLNLDQLIKKEMIDPAYKDGKNGYRFRVEMTDKGPQVYADPINASEKSRHFMIDAWGNMRAEEGRAATVKSPLVQPPAWLRGLIPKPPQRQIPSEID